MRGEAMAEAAKLVHLAFSDRAAALERVRRGVGIVRAHIYFGGAELGRRVNATGRVRVVGAGRVSLGDHVEFTGGMIPSIVTCHAGAELVIGEWSGFNYGAIIDCRRAIHIGKRCLFGSMLTLRDGPITIEDDVWVAHGVLVEPGVRIGAGSVISAGSVVASDVPPGSLVSGNPAVCYPLDAPR